MSIKSLLGVNLEGLCDWSQSRMFIDLIKTSRTWGKPGSPWDNQPGTIKVDSNGWPLDDAGTCLFTEQPNPAGTYKFSCTGKCTPSPVACSIDVQNLVYDPNTNKTTADLVISNTGVMNAFIGFNGTSGGIKDVKILRPGYASDSVIFTDEFLQALAPFGTVRFMDYLATNNSPLIHWVDRVTPATAQFTDGRGGPYEYAIALGNMTNKDIWLHVPHQADDDFIQQLATLVKTTLKPGINCYIEYSNEVWNFSFSQGNWNLTAAKTQFQNDAQVKSILDPLGCNDENGWRWVRVAWMTKKISNIFKQTFGGALGPIRPVLCTQIAWFGQLNAATTWLASVCSVKDTIYGVAGAPYFGISQTTQNDTALTTDKVFADITGSGVLDISANNKYINEIHRIAKLYGVKSMSYEGGPDLAQTSACVDVKIAASFDPRMGQCLQTYYTNWFNGGGDVFNHYTLTSLYNQSGYWGLVNDPRNLSTPKWVAAKAIADAHPITDVTPLPTEIKLYGVPFGTPGSWNNSGNDFSKVFDGNITTYFDSSTATGACVGLDFGAIKAISSIRFYPRPTLSQRMIGGVFQGSNDNTNWTTVYTITTVPPEGQMSIIPLAAASYRYMRYLAPINSYGNIAELEFYTPSSTVIDRVAILTDKNKTVIYPSGTFKIDVYFKDGSVKRVVG